MSTNAQAQDILGLLALLLQYPSAAWWESLPMQREWVDSVEDPQIQPILQDFLDYVEAMGLREYEDQYVRTFDFSKNTNLYLTTHDCTDVGKQAAELVDYKAFFLANGFEVHKEMPDYVPALLELCSRVTPEEAVRILQFAKRKLELLRSRFVEAKLPYAFLIDVALTMLSRLEVA